MSYVASFGVKHLSEAGGWLVLCLAIGVSSSPLKFEFLAFYLVLCMHRLHAQGDLYPFGLVYVLSQWA